MKFRIITFLLLCTFPLLKGATFYVTDFGAKADGTTINTQSIQTAIDQCSAKGGGKVVLDGGVFLSGTILLRDHITSYIEKGSTLRGTPGVENYPYQDAGFRFFGDGMFRQALVFAKNAVDVGIQGEGVIDGQGHNFIPASKKKSRERYMNRPYLLWFVNCKKVAIKQVELRNSGIWMQFYLGCDDLLIDGIKIWNHANMNNDMMDIDGCRNVIVTNVRGDSDDDGITFKSTFGRMSENIVVSNCIISSHCNGIKFGTETTAGYKNVTISNCVIKPSEADSTIFGLPGGITGLSIEIVDGGTLDGLNISNLVIDGPQSPLFIRLGNRGRKHFDGAPTPSIGTLKNVFISNLYARSNFDLGCVISGIKGGIIENVQLSNIKLDLPGGGKAINPTTPIEEKENLYPEVTMFGDLPTYGFYIRHARNIRFDNVQINLQKRDDRTGILLDDVHNAVFNMVSSSHTAQSAPFFHQINSSQVKIQPNNK